MGAVAGVYERCLGHAQLLIDTAQPGGRYDRAYVKIFQSEAKTDADSRRPSGWGAGASVGRILTSADAGLLNVKLVRAICVAG